MKKMTQWLALLLAGLMVASTLISCDSGYDWSEEEDDKEEQSEPSRYEDLAPEEIPDALRETDQFTIISELITNSDGKKITIGQTYQKYGNLMRDTWEMSSAKYDGEQFENDPIYQIITYVDLADGLIYKQEDERWIAQEWDNDLESFLNDFTTTDLFFSNDNYQNPDVDADRYLLKEEVLRKYFGLRDDATVEGYMSRNGNVYVFSITATSEDGTTISSVLKIRFTSDKIELPNVDLPTTEEGGDSPLPKVEE